MKYLLIILLFFSCKKQESVILKKTNTKIEYATGFDIVKHDNYTALIIKSPFPEAKNDIQYILVSNDSIKKTIKSNATIVQIPINRIVVTSTTHIPMLELLNEEKSLVGFPNTRYISSKKTRKLIDNNSILELGKEQNINTELLLDLNPDAVIGFSLNSNNKMFQNIEKFGIPVLLNGDWLEKTPLGRAEWIKFFGALYGKEQLADSIFNTIKSKYNKIKNLTKSSRSRPKIMSGVLFKEQWNLPAGNSYVAQFLRDANVNYPWQDTKGSGSLALSFESVFDKVKDADIWIGPGFFESFKQLEKANKHYTAFKTFKNKEIYNFTKRKGETGGVLYFELAPMQPHIVLKDIIKIAHPELLKDYKPFYLSKID